MPAPGVQTLAPQGGAWSLNFNTMVTRVIHLNAEDGVEGACFASQFTAILHQEPSREKR